MDAKQRARETIRCISAIKISKGGTILALDKAVVRNLTLPLRQHDIVVVVVTVHKANDGLPSLGLEAPLPSARQCITKFIGTTVDEE